MAASESASHLHELFVRIYAVARKIPRGRVVTYGELAELAGIPRGGRIAGASLKNSHRAPGVPWQRVIGKAGRGRGRIAIHDPVGAAIQRQLLEREGVEVGDRGLIALDEYGWRPGAALRVGSGRGGRLRPPPRSGSKSRASSSRR